MLTDQQLAEIKIRIDEATPGELLVQDANCGDHPLPFWVISKEAETDDWFVELHCGYHADAVLFANARNDLARLVEAVHQLHRDRDEAIAHDRQPYPTVDAYERACAALEKHRQRADVLHGVLREAQARLLAVSAADDLRLFVRLAIEEDRKARNESLGDVPVSSAPAAEEDLSSDMQALNDRRATGCAYDTGLCMCPGRPYEYEGCKARSSGIPEGSGA